MAEVLDIVVRQRGARRVSKDIAAIGVSATSASDRLKMFQRSLKGVTTGLNQTSTASSRFTQQCQKTSKCTDRATAGLKRTRLGLSGVGTGAFVAGAALTAGFTRPLIAAITAAGDFQAAMNLVGVLTNIEQTSVAFKSLEQTALNLGTTTKFTATEAAQGMRFLAITGLEADEVMAVIPTTLNLAAAASIGLGRASDIATNILKGFRLEVEDLPQAVDILAATFTASNVDIEQLADAFRDAGPVAVEFGQEFKDVAAIIGTLGDAGIQGQKAGVVLRRMFINLQTDSAKTTSILRKFGISIQDDVTGKMRPLIDIFKDIDKAGLLPTERIKLFGARALAAAGIIENSVQGLDKFAEAISNSVGRAAEIGAIQLKGFKGETILLSSALNTLGIVIARSGLLDFFTKLVEGLTKAIRFMGELPKPILFVAGTILTLGAILGSILVPIGLLAVGLSTLKPLFVGATFAGFTASVASFIATVAPVILIIIGLVKVWQRIKDIQFEVGSSTVTLSALMTESFVSIGKLFDEAVLGFELLLEGSGSTTNALAKDSKEMESNLPSFNEFAASAIASFEIFGRVVAAVFVRIGKGLGGFASDVLDAVKAIPEALKAIFDGDESTNAGSILALKFRNGFIKQFEGFGDEVKAIVEDATKKANSALSLLGQSDFVKRAAARVNPIEDSVGGGGGTKKGKGGGGDDNPRTGFSEQQLRSAEAVAKLTEALAPGTAAIRDMVKATTTLNDAQQLGVITGRQNVAILGQIRDTKAEDFLASINPVTAAYRDQRKALDELQVAKELFNLTDQETAIASELIFEQTQARLLQLDQFKEKLSAIDAARLGLSVGFKDFVKSLGTQFDILAQGAQKLGNVFSNSLTTALSEGSFAFKDFARTAISAIQSIIVQLIIEIALRAIIKALGGGGSSIGNNGGSQGNNLAFAQPMVLGKADGGSVGAGETFLVGEQGPELFTPKSSGDITPNKQTASLMNAQAPAPVVNVQVVNISDESGVPDAMSTVEGEKVIINTIQKNRNQLKEFF